MTPLGGVLLFNFDVDVQYTHNYKIGRHHLNRLLNIGMFVLKTLTNVQISQQILKTALFYYHE